MGLTVKAIEVAIRTARKEGRILCLWDDKLPGFGCRVTPKGHASWIVRKYLGKGGRGSKRVLHTLGPSAELTIDQARDQALTHIAEIRTGIDPAEVVRKERLAQKRLRLSGKLSDVVTAYIKKKRQPGRYWSEVEQLFNREVLSALGKDMLIANITRADIRSLIEAKEDKHPGAARSLFAAIRPFFKWCVGKELIEVSPCFSVEIGKPLKARDRKLTDYELTTLWASTHALGWPFGSIYRLLILTAQRRDEVAGMRHSELDLAKCLWVIPGSRTKNGKEHLVHLSPQAMEEIRYQPEIIGCDLVFSTTGRTQVSGYSRAKENLDIAMLELMRETNAKAELVPFRIHDLRRTAASGMAALGFQPHIIERVLNHVSGAQGGLVGVYQRHEYFEERKRALEAWGSYIAKLLANEQGSEINVLKFRIRG